jgi:glycosyltransferase involved in cell wall biosynthesis
VALRVLVDATGVPADRGAQGRYVDGLIGALGATGTDVAVACQLADEERYRRHAPDATIVAGPVGLGHRTERIAWEQSGLPVLAERVGADVLHMPYYSMPMRPGLPTAVTIHDVTFFTDPERYTASHVMSLKSATTASARQATRLIVPSNATRDELVRVLGVEPGKIDVAYHGVDHDLFHRPTPEQVTHVTARLGLRGKTYIAFLGSLTPRKNAPAVVRGWAQAVADLEDPPALVLAAPSRGEGFGLPVLEAMACGAPVLTTYRTSLPEVGGDAVAYTEPEAESIATALRALLDDPGRRVALGEAGHARAREFTWAASAAAHAASYKRAAESRSPGRVLPRAECDVGHNAIAANSVVSRRCSGAA